MQLKALLVKALLASVASASCIASEQGGCAEVDSKRDIEKGPVELDPAKAAGESLLDDGSFQLVRRDCRQDCENQYYKCNDDCKVSCVLLLFIVSYCILILTLSFFLLYLVFFTFFFIMLT